jgi:hypothetical protein
LSFAPVQSTSLAPVPEQGLSVPRAQGGPYRTVAENAVHGRPLDTAIELTSEKRHGMWPYQDRYTDGIVL